MSKKLSLKFLLRLSIVTGFIYCLWLSSGTADSQNSPAGNNQVAAQGKISIPLVASQLPLVDGVIPLELKCDTTVLLFPDTLDRIPCAIRNNSDKVVIAMVLRTLITIDNNGKVSAESAYTTLDFFVHPDIYIKSKSKGLKPQSETQFPSARESYDGIIKELQVHIDYVEFVDKKTAGFNGKAAEIVAGTRAGAAKYKAWLTREFQTSGASADGLVRLLAEAQPSASELLIENSNEEDGAQAYRNHLRRIYRTEGIAELMKQWNKANGS